MPFLTVHDYPVHYRPHRQRASRRPAARWRPRLGPAELGLVDPAHRRARRGDCPGPARLRRQPARADAADRLPSAPPAAHIPHGAFAEVPGAGHWLPRDAPKAVATHLLELITVTAEPGTS